MRYIFFFLFTLFSATLASAQQLISTEGDWRVFSMTQDGKKLCYIASSPQKSKGTFKKRGDAYLLVTYKSPTQGEINASSGYPYKKDTDVHLTFNGGKKYRLFTQGEQAWARDAETDKDLTEEMKKGSSLVLRGTSRIGSYSEDTYSLKGFTNALETMNKACK